MLISTVKIPPHLYVVIRFTSKRPAGIFPSLEAAVEHRDTHCKSADVYACRVLENAKELILGAKLA